MRWRVNMKENQRVKGITLNIYEKPNYNLVEFLTEAGEVMKVSDWNKRPVKSNITYFFEVKANNGFFNVQTVTDEEGNEIESEPKDRLKSIKELTKRLTKEIDALGEVV